MVELFFQAGNRAVDFPRFLMVFNVYPIFVHKIVVFHRKGACIEHVLNRFLFRLTFKSNYAILAEHIHKAGNVQI